MLCQHKQAELVDYAVTVTDHPEILEEFHKILQADHQYRLNALVANGHLAVVKLDGRLACDLLRREIEVGNVTLPVDVNHGWSPFLVRDAIAKKGWAIDNFDLRSLRCYKCNKEFPF